MTNIRPIDANALVNDLYNDIPIRAFGSCKRIGEMIKYIEKRPTIEAVPVVRCKDCGNWDDSPDGRYFGGWCFCNLLQFNTPPDWFCAYGERKEENDEA